jgi:hypothetical protein
MVVRVAVRFFAIPREIVLVLVVFIMRIAAQNVVAQRRRPAGRAPQGRVISPGAPNSSKACTSVCAFCFSGDVKL